MSHIPNQKEKTLRYPGHAGLISALQQSGFFSRDKIMVNGQEISPLDFTSKILLREWKLEENEKELTVMKVVLHGEGKTIEYNLLDYYDLNTQTTSMARSTGYTCTASVNLIINKLFKEKGVFPPELIGEDKICFDFVLNYLKERGVIWKMKQIDRNWLISI